MSLLAAAAAVALTFSAYSPGPVPAPPFRVLSLPKIPANEFALVEDAGRTVLAVRSRAASASLGLATPGPVTPATLRWKWKISRTIARADLASKAGDDFAARVYVFFDVPLASLSFAERNTLRLARWMSGQDVPAAALCYVWDNRHPAGSVHPSAYTPRVKLIVLRSGDAEAGRWVAESRDLAADWARGFAGPMPAVTGIAVGSDTDNTGEAVETWFGDVAVSP